MLNVTELTGGYHPEIDILHGIDLHVQRDEIVTILGPNGCGKSTLLKACAGFLIPRKGHVELNGRPIEKIPAYQKVRTRDIGFVPQTDNVFRTLTVRENILLGGRTLPKSRQAQQLESLLDQYPVLRQKLNEKAASLSGGERQLLSLARALMPEPRLLLLDEPSAGLSPKMLAEVFSAIVNIRSSTGLSVLMVEQNAVEALNISDRAYVLSLGKVVMQGTGQELLNDPQMKELYLGGV